MRLERIILSVVFALFTLGAAAAHADDAGAKVKVKWKGTWYPATVKTKDEGKKCWNIHYDGFEASWDECVAADRIKGLPKAEPAFAAGAKVQVKWKGKWYPATVKSHDSSKKCWAIHYDGFEASWDECVGAARIK